MGIKAVDVHEERDNYRCGGGVPWAVAVVLEDSAGNDLFRERGISWDARPV